MNLYSLTKENLLGRGGNSAHVILINGDPPTAAKCIHKGNAKDEMLFVKECRTLQFLSHPNIVQFFGVDETDVYHVIKMEYCERNSLHDVIMNRQIVYSMPTVYWWAEHLFAALAYLEGISKVHRDIKPRNVLVKSNWILKLADFGCLRDLDISTSLSFVGTCRYMSPEGYRNQDRQLSPMNDLYSIGLVLWEIVERRVVHLKYGVGRQFTHVPFFRDLCSGEYRLEEIDCSNDELRELVARCTAPQAQNRPNIKESWKLIEEKINRAGTDESFYPITLDDPQQELITPTQRDGARREIEVKCDSDFTISDLNGSDYDSVKKESDLLLTTKTVLDKSSERDVETLVDSGYTSAGTKESPSSSSVLTDRSTKTDKARNIHTVSPTNENSISKFPILKLVSTRFRWICIAAFTLLIGLTVVVFWMYSGKSEKTTDKELLDYDEFDNFTATYKSSPCLEPNMAPLVKIPRSYFFDMERAPEIPFNKSLLHNCSDYYWESLWNYHQMHKNFLSRIMNLSMALDGKGDQAILRSDIEQLFGQLRDRLSKNYYKNQWFSSILMEREGIQYFVISQKPYIFFKSNGDVSHNLNVNSLFKNSLEKGDLTKKKELHLYGFHIDMFALLLWAKLEKKLNAQLSPAVIDAFPFIHYRFEIDKALTDFGPFVGLNPGQIESYEKLRKLFSNFFDLMQMFDATKEDKNLIPKLVNLKMELQEERGCPNYFLFAKLKSDSERFFLESPTNDRKKVRIISEDLMVETVDHAAYEVSGLPFKIITSYHLIVQIDLMLMEIRPKMSSLADHCNDCICAVETGNCKKWGCIRETSCGYFQLTSKDYEDCQEPGKLPSDTTEAAWKRCSSDYECSLNCTNAYYHRHKHLCTETNMSECERRARIHMGGPYGCASSDGDKYWDEIKKKGCQ